MKGKALRIVSMLAVLVILMGALAGCSAKQGTEATTRTITDMSGRTVEIPVTVNMVLSTAPPTTNIIYMLAPDKLGGWNFQVSDSEAKYIPEQYRSLPVVGGWFGKQTGNYETFINAGPDIVLEGFTTTGDASSANERQLHFGTIPVVAEQDTANVAAYEEAITFLGDILGAQKKAKELLKFYTDAKEYVAGRLEKIPDGERKTVYYAEGKDGLLTDPKGSQHSILIDLCGGVNVADCKVTPGMGQTPVSMEQVLKWNPEVIIVNDATAYAKILSDSTWAQLKAVQNKKVYLVPHGPFSWFDRPPGVNQIIGIYWMFSILYPDQCTNLDLEKKTKEFYSKFIHYDLSDDEVTALLNPA